MKDFFKSLFGASSKEITGLSALILVLVTSLLVPKVVGSLTTKDEGYLVEDEKLLDSLLIILEKGKANKLVKEGGSIGAHKFNPNEASGNVLQALGFSEKVANRIINYREKGGSFAIKGDLYKIYDIDSSRIDELYDFIDLPIKHIKRAKNKIVKEETVNEARVTNRTISAELPNFDINTADTAMLQTIQGIGSVFSRRIIDFRDNLGGFVSVNQLFEVYNLDSLVVERLINKIFIDGDFVQEKLLINYVNEVDLAAHPYISRKQARLIIAYRNQHGDYSSKQDLQKVYAVEENDVQRVASYIDWEPSN